MPPIVTIPLSLYLLNELRKPRTKKVGKHCFNAKDDDFKGSLLSLPSYSIQNFLTNLNRVVAVVETVVASVVKASSWGVGIGPAQQE